jgi:nitroreductase
MTAEASGPAVPIPAGQADYLIATAARAPSVHNTQPWRFRAGEYAIELYARLLDAGGPPPAATAVLLTRGDGRADWLRAGQALHRLLAHAASNWVFASLHTQPLEAAAIRALIRDRLALPGAPQMLLQLGLAHTAHTTARRPPDDLIEP